MKRFPASKRTPTKLSRSFGSLSFVSAEADPSQRPRPDAATYNLNPRLNSLQPRFGLQRTVKLPCHYIAASFAIRFVDALS